jgi:hypothetical protein
MNSSQMSMKLVKQPLLVKWHWCPLPVSMMLSEPIRQCIRYWAYVIPNLSELNLSDSKLLCYWTYLILSPSDTESTWYRTHQMPNLSDTKPISFRTYQKLNLSDTDLRRSYQILNLTETPGSVSVRLQVLRLLLTWLSVPCSRIVGETGPSQSCLHLPPYSDCQYLPVPCGKIWGWKRSIPFPFSPSSLQWTTNLF